MNKREIAAGIVLIRIESGEPLVLLLQRKSGIWDLCQGRLEESETLKAGCLRELWEETGIKEVVFDREFRHTIYYLSHKTSSPQAKCVTYFLGITDSAEVKVRCREHLAYKWSPFPEAISLLSSMLKRQVLIVAAHWIFLRSSNYRKVSAIIPSAPGIDLELRENAIAAAQYMLRRLLTLEISPDKLFSQYYNAES
jgi:8-oxo-dGTP pyrophosphatase MutT (NUDIX family)